MFEATNAALSDISTAMAASGNDFPALADPHAACNDLKATFRESGLVTIQTLELIRILEKLDPSFSSQDLDLLVTALRRDVNDTVGCDQLVDWLFNTAGTLREVSDDERRPPASLILGDLGSGKTSVYFVQRQDEMAVSVEELPDASGAVELPGLADCSFEEFARRFYEAATSRGTGYEVHIGATQWYRALPPEHQVELAARLRRWGTDAFVDGFRLVQVSGEQEAEYEAIAVRHACQAALGVTPQIIMSAGTGSMQCTATNTDGTGSCGSVQLDTKEWAKRPREDLPVWRSVASEALVPLAPLLSVEGQTAVCVGAAWYAINAAKFAGKADPPFAMPRQEAISGLVACCEDPATSVRDAVNVWRVVEALALMVHVHDVVFARNWQINGNPFRTTWAVGYFLSTDC